MLPSRWLVFSLSGGVISLLTSAAVLQAEGLPDYLQPRERAIATVFQQTSPSVVNVSNVRVTRNFFSRQSSEVPSGSGSGFVWDQKGHIVTNYHVVHKSNRVYVSFKSGKRVEAKFVGAEPKKDIAILKVKQPKGGGLVPVRVAAAPQVFVGQQAIAIGSPFGLEQTLTVGIVSALGRSVPGIGKVTIRDMIQTDASINPGNSGGPLLDSRGFLLGMNTAIFSKSGGSAGIGFAVPAGTIKRIVTQIIRFGRVRQPGIGVSLIPDHYARRWGIDGVIILDVRPGGPAAKAGLRGAVERGDQIVPGDVIIKVGDERVRTYDDLYNALEDREIGGSVEVTFLRGRKEMTVAVDLIDINRSR